MVRKFLYIVAGLILLAIIAAFAFSIWTKEITRIAMVPTAEFVEQTPLEGNAYTDPGMWYSRPGMGVDDPARWQPAWRVESEEEAEGSAPAPAPTAVSGADLKPGNFAVFFIHPTSYFSRSTWNAPLDDPDAQSMARLFIRGLASPFNKASEIWAPRYRQATFGAFLTEEPEGQKAIDAAYEDVKQAYAFFLASVDKDTPIVLAGHSQGALHLIRLLHEEVANAPEKPRIAAVYVVGWPISVEKDLPALGFPACAASGQPGCIMSWSSFAEPADPSDVMEVYGSSLAFDGTPRGTSPILCTNPITGSTNGTADAADNVGTLVPDDDLSNGELVPGAVPARCDERGLLLIGDPPKMGSAVLPGNNYHVYDMPLFWSNLQRDVVARVDAWQAQR